MLSPPPTTSPLTGKAVPDHYTHASSLFFQDTSGRSLLLRGVNLSGSAKNPLANPQEKAEDFWESAEDGSTISWVNQPLDLEDGSADVSLSGMPIASSSPSAVTDGTKPLCDYPGPLGKTQILGLEHAPFCLYLGGHRACWTQTIRPSLYRLCDRGPSQMW